jgi:hypothetical protein
MPASKRALKRTHARAPRPSRASPRPGPPVDARLRVHECMMGASSRQPLRAASSALTRWVTRDLLVDPYTPIHTPIPGAVQALRQYHYRLRASTQGSGRVRGLRPGGGARARAPETRVASRRVSSEFAKYGLGLSRATALGGATRGRAIINGRGL